MHLSVYMTCTQSKKLQKDKQEINFVIYKNPTAVNKTVKKNLFQSEYNQFKSVNHLDKSR